MLFVIDKSLYLNKLLANKFVLGHVATSLYQNVLPSEVRITALCSLSSMCTKQLKQFYPNLQNSYTNTSRLLSTFTFCYDSFSRHSLRKETEFMIWFSLWI